ncbi:MAG: hypothetical protein JJ992_24120 [Planctomycetes bacterium]|nr:hypothetical protein [Planctomycetota bacterium]
MFGFRWQYALCGLAIFLVTLVASAVVIGVLIVNLPATYFLDSHNRDLWIDHHPLIRWSGIILKNAAGYTLILVGLLLSLPGIPGQGLLTILLGLILLDFPGKRRLERWILHRPRLLARINRLRGRFGRAPLRLEESD